jgi:hypothetical protein
MQILRTYKYSYLLMTRVTGPNSYQNNKTLDKILTVSLPLNICKANKRTRAS